MHYNILGVSLAYGTDVDDEYHALVDKYATVRKDFETHMTESCKVSISWPVYSSHHECKYLAYYCIYLRFPFSVTWLADSVFMVESFYGVAFFMASFFIRSIYHMYLFIQFLHTFRAIDFIMYDDIKSF